MRRDMLQRDLSALIRGEGGSSISAVQASFYGTRLAAVNGLLAGHAKSVLKIGA